ncbi:ATP-binding protein [Streptomyces aureus]|uniref:ATP-binding protein n=1 Tax=Streptomyces aureus TaxID=193461 RepID=UPI00131EA88E|nr:ATP-binding protein [Streptomyces aureus]
MATLHRAIKDELRAGRVLQVARAASGRVEPSRYDRALAELGFAEGANGPPVVDGPDAMPSGTGGEQRPGAVKTASRTRVSGGVRLYAPGARLVSTRQVAGVVEAVGHTVAARGIGCVYGDTGLGKTVAVEQALHLLPARVPVWRAVVGVRPGLPQVRAALCEALGLPSGSLTHRAGPADQALAEVLAEPGVLFLDDAQRLSPPVLDYLRQLWDLPGCAAALVLCGAGSERALARAAAMRSRVLTWHQVSRLDTQDVPRTLGLFHPVWEDADPADLGRADEQTPRQLPYLGEDHLTCLCSPGPRPRCGCGSGRDRPGLRPARSVLMTATLTRPGRIGSGGREPHPVRQGEKRRDDGERIEGYQRRPRR